MVREVQPGGEKESVEHVSSCRCAVMRTYTFKVVVEPDADRWHAYARALKEQGGATWGYTRGEALKNIHEVIPMVIESLIEHGESVPEGLTVQPRN